MYLVCYTKRLTCNVRLQCSMVGKECQYTCKHTTCVYWWWLVEWCGPCKHTILVVAGRVVWSMQAHYIGGGWSSGVAHASTLYWWWLVEWCGPCKHTILVVAGRVVWSMQAHYIGGGWSSGVVHASTLYWWWLVEWCGPCKHTILVMAGRVVWSMQAYYIGDGWSSGVALQVRTFKHMVCSQCVLAIFMYMYRKTSPQGTMVNLSHNTCIPAGRSETIQNSLGSSPITFTHARTHAHTHTCTRKYTHVHACTHTCTHTYSHTRSPCSPSASLSEMSGKLVK